MALDLKNIPKTVTKTTVNSASILSGVNDAKDFKKGQYFNEPGTYIAEVKKCLMKKSEAKGSWMYIMEFTITKVIESSNQPTSPTEGSERTYVQSLENSNVAFPKLKEFYLAAAGPFKDPTARKEAEDKTQAMLEAAADENIQAFKGSKVKITVVPHTTKKNILIHLPYFEAIEE